MAVLLWFLEIFSCAVLCFVFYFGIKIVSTATTKVGFCETCVPSAMSGWLKNIPDAVPFKKLTLPGTHNSCAHEINILAQCQNVDLNEQLKMGVRYFDIRLDNDFQVAHGIFKTCINMQQVQSTCIDFLTSEPSEFIIVLVSPNSTTDASFVERFEKLLNKKFWYAGGDDVIDKNVGQLRGKMILFRKFYTSHPLGVDMSGWLFDLKFSKLNNVPIMVHDYSSASLEYKVDMLDDIFLDLVRRTEYNDKFFILYTSANNWPLEPPSLIAHEIFHRLETKWLARFAGGMIVVVDFASNNIINKIIAKNNFVKYY